MSEVFTTPCVVCSKAFRSRKALERHFIQRHPGRVLPATSDFYLSDAAKVQIPLPKALKKGKSDYLDWLSVVVECLNSAHYPRAPGKWYHMDFPNVPLAYFTHLMQKMGITSANSVRETRHVKFPLWTDRVKKISYKTTCRDDFVAALSEQKKVPLHMSKAFRGYEEVTNNPQLTLRGRDALEAAKRGLVGQVPTKRSEINISEGEGRATRECELIWWPLYNNTSCGKFTMRVYFGKVDI